MPSSYRSAATSVRPSMDLKVGTCARPGSSARIVSRTATASTARASAANERAICHRTGWRFRAPAPAINLNDVFESEREGVATDQFANNPATGCCGVRRSGADGGVGAAANSSRAGIAVAARRRRGGIIADQRVFQRLAALIAVRPAVGSELHQPNSPRRHRRRSAPLKSSHPRSVLRTGTATSALARGPPRARQRESEQQAASR